MHDSHYRTLWLRKSIFIFSMFERTLSLYDLNLNYVSMYAAKNLLQ